MGAFSNSKSAQASAPEYDKSVIEKIIVKCDSVSLGQPITECDFKLPEELNDIDSVFVSVHYGSKQKCQIENSFDVNCVAVPVPNQTGIFNAYIYLNDIKYETSGAAVVYEPSDVMADMLLNPEKGNVDNLKYIRATLLNLNIQNQQNFDLDDLKCDFYGAPKTNDQSPSEWVLLEKGISYQTSKNCSALVSQSDTGEDVAYELKVSVYSEKVNWYRFNFYSTIYTQMFKSAN
ncbi:MAG: hypothetical protein OHK0017_09780 [Patescibacteria group bacterium]